MEICLDLLAIRSKETHFNIRCKQGIGNVNFYEVHWRANTACKVIAIRQQGNNLAAILTIRSQTNFIPKVKTQKGL